MIKLLLSVSLITFTLLLFSGNTQADSFDKDYTNAVNACINAQERTGAYCERAVLAATVKNLLQVVSKQNKIIYNLERAVIQLMKQTTI